MKIKASNDPKCETGVFEVYKIKSAKFDDNGRGLQNKATVAVAVPV